MSAILDRPEYADLRARLFLHAGCPGQMCHCDREPRHTDPTNPHLTPADVATLADRQTALDAVPGPRVGDYVTYADGTMSRVSAGPRDLGGDRVQTSPSGSFYLGNGHVSFSGGLDGPIPVDSLTDTGESRLGEVWFFHRDRAWAHNGVHMRAMFRVFSTTVTHRHTPPLTPRHAERN